MCHEREPTEGLSSILARECGIRAKKGRRKEQMDRHE